MSHPQPITSIKLRVTNSNTSDIYEHTIASSQTGTNSIKITDAGLINAFASQPQGTIFYPSMVVNYQNGVFSSGNEVTFSSISEFTKIPQTLASNGFSEMIRTYQWFASNS